MRLAIAALTAWFILSCTPAFAHVTDEAGCMRTLYPFMIGALETKIVSEGVTPDNVDFVITLKAAKGGLYVVHFPLLPVAQWPMGLDGQRIPTPFNEASSVWIDLDENGKAEDIWTVVRPELECKGVVHLRWSEKAAGYVLVEGGRDHV